MRCCVAVVVELLQAYEDNPQKRYSCAWKVDELITVGTWGQGTWVTMDIVIAMVGCVRSWMEVMVGRHAAQSQEGLVIC